MDDDVLINFVNILLKEDIMIYYSYYSYYLYYLKMDMVVDVYLNSLLLLIMIVL